MSSPPESAQAPPVDEVVLSEAATQEPKPIHRTQRRVWLPLILFVLTMVSTFVAGATGWTTLGYVLDIGEYAPIRFRLALLQHWQDGLLYMPRATRGHEHKGGPATDGWINRSLSFCPKSDERRSTKHGFQPLAASKAHLSWMKTASCDSALRSSSLRRRLQISDLVASAVADQRYLNRRKNLRSALGTNDRSPFFLTTAVIKHPAR